MRPKDSAFEDAREINSELKWQIIDALKEGDYTNAEDALKKI